MAAASSTSARGLGGAAPLLAAAAGAAAGAAGYALWCRRSRVGVSRAKAVTVAGTDFRGQASSYVRSQEGVVGLLAYEICEPLSEEEYDRWLFGEHYHDLMANPHLQKIVLHTVSKDKKARLSTGAEVDNKVGFFRLAELHFRDFAAFDSYVDWFRANVIPAERGPAGRSAFKFYHLAGTECIERGGSGFLGGVSCPSAAASPAAAPTQREVSQAAGGAPSDVARGEEPARGGAKEATVLVIGASGNIGGEVVRQLRARPGVTVVEASTRAEGPGKVKVDIGDAGTLRALDQALPGGVDHVVVCCGDSTFGPLASFDSRKWEGSCNGKLVAVTRLIVVLANGEEVKCLRPGGSITVTAGQSARTVNRMWPGLALNNAGLEAFVRCAGLDAPRGVRINAVAPCLVRETAAKAKMSLEGTVPAAEAGAAYLPLVLGTATGEVVDVGKQQVFSKSHKTS